MTASFSDRKRPRTICLFDVDGTLTPSRLRVTEDVKEMLRRLRKECVIGFVGGSDLAKQREQLGEGLYGDGIETYILLIRLHGPV